MTQPRPEPGLSCPQKGEAQLESCLIADGDFTTLAGVQEEAVTSLCLLEDSTAQGQRLGRGGIGDPADEEARTGHEAQM